MEILEKLSKSYDDFYRRFLSINRDTWTQYTRSVPFMDWVLRNIAHPVLGGPLRRMFRFEGPDRHTQSHIVPINQDISYQSSNQNQILPIQQLRQVIEDSSYRVLLNRCLCRDGFSCTNYPRDLGCIMLGEACRHMVARGIARQATVEECHAHLDRAAELGLVAICAWAEFEALAKGIPEDQHKNYFEICLCCSCCCLGMRNFKEMFQSDHMRKVFRSIGWRAQSTGSCAACGMCADICPTKVIEVMPDSIQVGEACLGCGLCAARCPEGAIVMEETAPMKESILDSFWGFRPQING